MSISPLAYVHPDARLGKDVTVEPFASVYGDVVIGDGSWIGPNSVLLDGARVGRNCKIFPGAVIAAIPQDLKFAGEKTTAEVGDGTTIRYGAASASISDQVPTRKLPSRPCAESSPTQSLA